MKYKILRLGLTFIWSPFALSKREQENDIDNRCGILTNVTFTLSNVKLSVIPSYSLTFFRSEQRNIGTEIDIF